MKRTLLVSLIFLCLGAACIAQTPHIIVYGTVGINQEIEMRNTEVSIQEWMDYIVNNDFDQSLFPDDKAISPTAKAIFDDLKKGSNFTFLKIGSSFPYQRLFGEKGISTTRAFDKLVKADTNYFSIKIPVTGITFEQARRFCHWREKEIEALYKIKVTVDLPSIEVYRQVIPNIDTLSKNGECFELNCSTSKCKVIPKAGANHYKEIVTQGKGLENVEAYFPTALGLHNIEGNAAEMTSTEGVAMGGSFRHTARESYNDRQQAYNKAEDWLGFRYIVILK